MVNNKDVILIYCTYTEFFIISLSRDKLQVTLEVKSPFIFYDEQTNLHHYIYKSLILPAFLDMSWSKAVEGEMT